VRRKTEGGCESWPDQPGSDSEDLVLYVIGSKSMQIPQAVDIWDCAQSDRGIDRGRL